MFILLSVELPPLLLSFHLVCFPINLVRRYVYNKICSMSLETKYNLKSPAVKRLMREASELRNPTEEYYACPLEDNLFEWHFTIQGPPDTDFEGGFYHGRIILPPQYPMQPPNIILLTPSGRFQVNKKICLSISGYHPESWQPSWSIRTALLALIAFMPTKGGVTVGSLDYAPDERRAMALASKKWECPTCGKIADMLLPGGKTSPNLTEEQSDLLRKAEDNSDQKEDVATVGHDSEEIVSQDSPLPGFVPRARLVVFRAPAYENYSNVETPVEGDRNENTYQTETRRSVNPIYHWPIKIYAILFAIVLILIRRLFFMD